LNKLEVNRFLEYLFCLPFPIPLLRDVADLASGKNRGNGPLKRRMERRYMRLCRLQDELGRLDLKKGAANVSSGVSPEDFIFSQIDFSRYRKIAERDFDLLFPEGLTDFDEAFFKKNFGLGRKEIQSTIEESYKKAEPSAEVEDAASMIRGSPAAGEYRLERETPLILSLMRTLETSPEAAPLFTAAEIMEELQNLPHPIKEKLLPGIKQHYPLFVSSLDNALVTHSDGMTTKLFISPGGDLSGTFRPGNKPWTQVLIPAELITA